MSDKNPWAERIASLVMGIPIQRPNSKIMGTPGGSLNQRGDEIALELLYACRFGKKSEVKEAIVKAVDWFERQLIFGHMSDHDAWQNEIFVSGNHGPIYERILGAFLFACTLAPKKKADASLLEEMALAWLVSDTAARILMADETGRFVGVEARVVRGKHGCVQVDARLRESLGMPQLGQAAKRDSGFWRLEDPEIDHVQVGTVLLAPVVRRAGPPFSDLRLAYAGMDGFLLAQLAPAFRNEVNLTRCENGHIAWSPKLDGFHDGNSLGTVAEVAISRRGQAPEYRETYSPGVEAEDHGLGRPLFTVRFPVAGTDGRALEYIEH